MILQYHTHMSASALDSPKHCAIALRGATSQLIRALRGVGAPGTGAAALSVMSLLYRHGPMAPSELARMEGVRIQTLTRLLSELEAQGCITRQPDPADRRRSVLSLAAGGKSKLAQYVHGHEVSLEAVMQQTLSPEERQTLLAAAALMERLAQKLVQP